MGDSTEAEGSGYRVRVQLRTLSLSSATRDYARAVESRTFDKATRQDLETWATVMGPWIWAWHRARRLAEEMPWRASTVAEEDHERILAHDAMLKAIATWEKALAALDAQQKRARMYDKPMPPPLAIPMPVAEAIKAKRQAALERATARRGGGSGGGGHGPALTPDDGASPIPPFPSKPSTAFADAF
jgi:hypothetical protein